MVNVSQVIKILDSIAPAHLKMEKDKIGLQVGGHTATVDKAMIALEITRGVVEEARAKGVNLIISHHPLIFRSLDRVVVDDFTGSIVTDLIKSDISVLVAHTNLDRAKYGVNEVLARTLGLQDIEVLLPARNAMMKKIVVFVPEENVEKMILAIGAAGAGIIGDYGYCTFGTSGTGTFYPHPGAMPHSGKVGELNRVPEIRLEALMPPEKLNDVIETMINVHPYEEVAYDVYEVSNPPAGVGLGRIGNLSSAKTLDKCVALWEEKLNCRLRVAGDMNRAVKRVAVCGGSGADLIGLAGAGGADVFVTGDVKHHAAHAALEIGLAVVDAGHAGTERLVVPELAKLMQVGLQEQALDLEIIISEIDTNPWVKE